MSSIDQVIARARTPGGFSERKRFTVARRRGIQKLRRFALADPHYYILELIQCAIGNGAAYVNIDVDEERCAMSYIGGGLLEHELAQLFDFLFASKDRADIGHVRELALGLNAALLFEPTRIVVESGDGTLKGTNRMEMHGDQDEVDIGKPDRPLAGTYVVIEGLQRGKLPDGFSRWAGDDPPRETGVVESRCLAAPIPIIVNHTPLFGYGSQRTPGVFGYKRALSFDEGDFYGTIGADPVFGAPSFRLLTNGVAIQSVQRTSIGNGRVGGVLCFDLLHKTVDHSGVVQDDRFEEMWLRLLPYVHQLLGEAGSSVYSAASLAGTRLSPAQLRDTLRKADRVVLAPPGTRAESEAGRRAAAISNALGVAVICAPAEHRGSLRVLAGGTLGIIAPDLTSDNSVAFYSSPPATPPRRPWLVPPVQVAPLPSSAIAIALTGESRERETMTQSAVGLTEALGGGEVTAQVYTPETGVAQSELSVSLLTTQREVWAGSVPSAYPGHVLRIELPDASVAGLWRPVDESPGSPSLAEAVARSVALHAQTALATAFDRAVSSLQRRSIEPGSAAAALGLAAITRAVVPRLRVLAGEPAVSFSQLEATGVDLMALPLFRKLDGATVTLADIGELMNESAGLVYGVIPSIAADTKGLNRSKILDLDETAERMLIALVGDGAYIRVDRRDVLAHADGLACRDVAVGLRDYPAFPLLVEGDDPTGWSEERQLAALEELLAQLVRRFRGVDPPRPEYPAELDGWEECRRQAALQLQWFVCARRREVASGRALDDFGASSLPLFLDAAESARSIDELAGALDAEPGLTLVYGRGFGRAELGLLTDAAQQEWDGEPEDVDTVAAPPFVHRCLAWSGHARPAFDFVIAPRPGASEEAFLASSEIDTAGMRGRIGVPSAPAAHPDIVVVLPDGDQARALTEIAREHSVVGWIRLDAGVAWSEEQAEQVFGATQAAADAALAEVIESLSRVTDAADLARRTAILLEYAAHHLVFTAPPQGPALVTVERPLAARVLALPMFASRFGGPVAAWRLVRRFCGLVGEAHAEPAEELLGRLAPALPAHLRLWVERTFRSAHVIREPGRPARDDSPVVAPAQRFDGAVLAATLEHWLDTLRPDRSPERTQVWITESKEEEWLTGGVQSVWLRGDHWLVEWARTTGGHNADAIAWLLLAIYGYVNAVLEPVTNEHEKAFHRRLAETLAAGELRPVAPSPRST